MLYNPYRNYDKGMDDAYMGIEPQDPQSAQYMDGYQRCTDLLNSEQEHERSVATEADSSTDDQTIKQTNHE